MPAKRPWLVVIAAPKEVRAALEGLCSSAAAPGMAPLWAVIQAGGAHIVRSGVGKSSAAGATAYRFDPERHAGVLSIGVGGSLPGSNLRIGDVVLAAPSLLGDDGVRTSEAFLGLDRIGFAEDNTPIHPDPGSLAALTSLVDRVGPVATVSAGSGTDPLAAEVAARTGAIVEAMEGASCGMSARRIDPGCRFAEIRVVSNTTGDRAGQTWDLEAALARMGTVLGPALGALGA